MLLPNLRYLCSILFCFNEHYKEKIVFIDVNQSNECYWVICGYNDIICKNIFDEQQTYPHNLFISNL